MVLKELPENNDYLIDLGFRFGAPSFSSSNLKPNNGVTNGNSAVGFSLAKPNRAPSPAVLFHKYVDRSSSCFWFCVVVCSLFSCGF